MRTATDLKLAARGAGLRLDQIETVPMPGAPDMTTLASRMSFDDPWAAARLLQTLSDEDASDPIVRAWSLAILEGVAEQLGEDAAGPTLSPELVNAYAEALHENVQDQIRFLHEPKETFQSARVTLASQAGDCDDHARLLYAAARAGGLPAQLVFFEEEGQPVHVVTKLKDALGWQWAETTIDADYGEEPFAALARLQIVDAHQNPLAQNGGPPSTSSLGFLGLEFVTPGDVATRKAQLDAAVSSLGADVMRCTTLDAGTVASWNAFVGGWRAFMGETPGYFNAGGQGRQAADFAEQIRDWQGRIGAACPLSAPLVPQPKPDPIVGTVTAIAVVVVAGAAAWTFAPAIRTALASRSSSRRRRGRA